MLRLRGKYSSRGKPPPKVGKLRCAKCGAEISWDDAGYIRISEGRIVAYCPKCLEEDLRAVGARIVRSDLPFPSLIRISDPHHRLLYLRSNIRITASELVDKANAMLGGRRGRPKSA